MIRWTARSVRRQWAAMSRIRMFGLSAVAAGTRAWLVTNVHPL
jgi:hypothetical protein